VGARRRSWRIICLAGGVTAVALLGGASPVPARPSCPALVVGMGVPKKLPSNARFYILHLHPPYAKIAVSPACVAHAVRVPLPF